MINDHSAASVVVVFSDFSVEVVLVVEGTAVVVRFVGDLLRELA